MKKNRRYYLHRRIKGFGRVFAKDRNGIIYLPHSLKLSDKQQFYVAELVKLGSRYSVQMEIK
jgi:hypothetical protein